MRYVKRLGLLAAAAAAMMAFAGVASATTLTSPAGTTYTSTIKLTSTNSQLHGSFVSVSCTHSTMEGKVEKHGSGITVGFRGSVNFSGCNYPVTVRLGGSFEMHGFFSRFTWTGGEFSIHTSIGECIFTTNGTDIGQFTGGTPAKLDIDSVAIPRTGGSFFCGSSGEWTGSYTFTTPGTLLVD